MKKSLKRFTVFGLITLIMLTASQGLTQTAELSSEQWAAQLADIKTSREKSLQRTINEITLVSKVRFQSLAADFRKNNEPVTVIIKSMVTGESWLFQDQENLWLETSFHKALSGSGFALVSFATHDGVPHYFIVGDRSAELVASSAQSLRCTQMMESYLKILSLKSREIRSQMKSNLSIEQSLKLIEEIPFSEDNPCFK